MANIKDWIKDKLGNIIVPKTLTSAVYDDNGTALSDTLDTLNSKFAVIYETDTFTICKLGNTVRLVGYATLSADIGAWTWVIDFTSLPAVYAPKRLMGITDLSAKYAFQLHTNKFIQSASALGAGTYNFDVSWKI